MKFDVRYKTRSEPKDFSADQLLSQVEVNKAETIDAIFVKEKAEIYLVQGQTYAGVDYMNMCSNPSSFAKAFKFGDTTDLLTRNRIDAITKNRHNQLLIFESSQFWVLNITSIGRPGVVKAQRQGNIGRSVNEY